MGRRLLRWGLYAACALPLLVLVALLVRALPVPEAWRQVVSLLLWGPAMLLVWMGLGRLLPDPGARRGEDG
jgi:hypothetical protein